MTRVLAILSLALGLLPRAALAEFDARNETQVPASVAIGYQGVADWLSESWWGKEFGDGPTCLLVTENAQRHLAVINLGDGAVYSSSYAN